MSNRPSSGPGEVIAKKTVSMKRGLIGMLILILAITLLVAIRLYARLQPVEAEPVPALIVETQKIVSQPFVQSLHATGTIEAEQRIVLSAQLAARVKSLPWREGDSVVKGDSLVQLDASEQRQEVARLKAALDRVKVDLEFWRVQLKTDRQLFKSGSISRHAFDETRRQVTGLEASLRETQQALKSARTRLGYAVIRAPFDGYLQLIHVREGEYARPGMALIEIVAIDPLKAVVAVTEADVQKLELNRNAQINVPAVGHTWAARLDRIYPALTQGSRNATLELLLPAGVNSLRPGMAVNVDIELQRSDQAMVIPLHALHHRAGETGVFLLGEGRAHWRSVEAGANQQGKVHIVSGLLAGDEIITTPHPQLADQRQVRVNNEWRSAQP